MVLSHRDCMLGGSFLELHDLTFEQACMHVSQLPENRSISVLT